MGYRPYTFAVSGSLADGDPEREQVDREAWKRFKAEIRRIADSEEYARLLIVVSDFDQY